jgi:diguanylate cyclase (GGDEF)-like protein
VRPSHTWQALAFIYLVDSVALVVLLFQVQHLAGTTLVEWLSAIFFAALMAAARVMPVRSSDHPNVDYGWYMAVEFAIIAALPLPLACLVHLPSVPVQMLHRWKLKVWEPFRGPDYNAAASILCVLVAGNLLRWLGSIVPDADGWWLTVSLIPAAAVFMVVQYLLLQTLVSLNHRVPWHKTGLLNKDSLIGDAMMSLLGALIGRLYVLDPSTILLTILPLTFLQYTMQRLQEARLVHVDSKTGLHNYRYLDVALNEEVRKATQSGRPLSLIFGDMDYLRDINNTYGHLAGDRALQSVASVFRRTARTGDVAARFGGEEFVLLLPGTEREVGFELAEQIRRGTAASRLETEDGGVFSVTISLGLASFPNDATTVQGLIKAADEAVYAAKHNGRNQVAVYQSGVAV